MAVRGLIKMNLKQLLRRLSKPPVAVVARDIRSKVKAVLQESHEAHKLALEHAVREACTKERMQ